jgi:hypothetical protein
MTRVSAGVRVLIAHNVLEETGFHGEWITWDLGSLGC